MLACTRRPERRRPSLYPPPRRTRICVFSRRRPPIPPLSQTLSSPGCLIWPVVVSVTLWPRDESCAECCAQRAPPLVVPHPMSPFRPVLSPCSLVPIRSRSDLHLRPLGRAASRRWDAPGVSTQPPRSGRTTQMVAAARHAPPPGESPIKSSAVDCGLWMSRCSRGRTVTTATYL